MLNSLQGVRILSLAEQYPGPYATMLLADLGADVIVIERPAGGDPTRRFAGHFEALNRNKRSIAIDLKSSRGREAFLALVRSADVVMEGFRPGVVDRLGISAGHLHRDFPELIYVSISGFGQDGPLHDRAGHDLSIQAAAGLLNHVDPAALPSLPLADLSSALFATIGTLVALVERSRSGRGTYVDVSMLDGLVSWMSTSLVSMLNGLTAAPHPPRDPGYGIFTTADGTLLALSIAGEDHLWRRLCEGLDLEDLAHLNEGDREVRFAEVKARLRDAIAARSTSRAEEILAARGITFARVNAIEQVAHDRHVEARDLIVGLKQDDAHRKYVRQPLVFDGVRSNVTRPAPQLGEHTRLLLGEAGYNAAEIESLIRDGVVASTRDGS